MPELRRTIVRDSVLRGPHPLVAAPPAAPEPVTAPAAPPAPAASAARQTAVWLAEEEIDWLDDQCRVLRRGGWRSVTRSALIRSLIQAAMARPVDLGGVADESGLAARVAGAPR